ncbi:hypothetical protein ACDI16_16235 [Oceanobacillus caeni]|uniref:hypothetical protein n=1 Tax=Virgibacillus sp. SK37 TaxID=403957 RepID=UPI001443A726|nr:hypothetical protein [Virgibacillus sp. SK37]
MQQKNANITEVAYELDGTGSVLEKKAKLKMSPVYYRTHFEQLTDEITMSNF